MSQITINWSQAQEMPDFNRENQQRQIKNFLSEYHEMTDGKDLMYWIDQTGKNLDWLVRNAQGLALNIYNAVISGGLTIDDIATIQPEHLEVDDWENPDEVYNRLHIFYQHTPVGVDDSNNLIFKYQILVSNDMQDLSFYYPDDDALYNSVDECKKVNKSDLERFYYDAEAEYLS
tara:strand:- start:80 stop:604 length:525 start_codon:yes stop_codon:yes gene_type:complete